MAIGWLLVALMALNNLDTWYRYQHDTKTTREEIATLQKQTQLEQTKLQDSERRLRSVNVPLMTAQTQYVNSVLAERAFSWSELLDRLERVIPAAVRLNADPHFARPFPNTETNTGTGYDFGISVDYRPTIARSVE